MAGTEAVNINVTSSGETTSSLIEKLGAAFTELEAQKVASTCGVEWNDVQEHLSHLESMVKKKLEEVEAKKKALSERESNNREVIAAREAEVLSMELDMLDRAQELKDAAVAAIVEAREMYVSETPEVAGVGDADGNKVNHSVENKNVAADAQEGKSPCDKDDEVDTGSELNQVCEEMDS